MSIISKLHQEIIYIARKKLDIDIDDKIIGKINLELPKNKSFGCLATNIAMILAKICKKNPMDLAEILKKEFLENIDNIEEVNIAKPAFINFSFKKKLWQEELLKIFLDKKNKIEIGKKEKINIEFGSPNPTGPLHIGHARGLIYGDVLANILEFADFAIIRENYVNDAGGQIDVLAKSLFFRYKEICTKEIIKIPQGFYPGDYLIRTAEKLQAEYQDKFLKQKETEYFPFLKKFAVKEMLELMKSSFKSLKIRYDVYFSELSLHKKDKINQVVDLLTKQKNTFLGSLPKPKGIDSQNWKEEEQLLFKATEFGDDMDRALQKSNKDWTYFAADCAYHYDKIDRGFKKMILVLGADHTGYVKRMKALVKAISQETAEIEIKLCQLVNFKKNGKILKMSKRAGSYITVDDVIEQVGSNALRFIMLTRKNDASLDFDLEKAVEQSKDNPIFYVQYAHTRIASVFRQSEIIINDIKDIDLSLLTDDAELELIKYLSLFEQVITTISVNYEVHRLSFYLLELSGLFHSYWNLGKINSNLRFISSNKNLTVARLVLLKSIQNIIGKGLRLFSITPLEKM